MATINYISDSKALEFLLPDGYSGDFISLTPKNANGNITLIKGTDYIITGGVIRFFRVPPKDTTISISKNINDIINPNLS